MVSVLLLPQEKHSDSAAPSSTGGEVEHPLQSSPQEPAESRELPETPLQKVIRQYVDRVPLRLRLRMRLAFAKALPALNEQKMSSACSGCDIAYICASELLAYWSKELCVPCKLEHGFACEHSREKQLFLKTQYALQDLFHDVSDLQKLRATDVLTGRQSYVSTCAIFTAGFSCKSRTPLSSKSAANRNCLQNHQADAETSYTFDHILAYIQKHAPQICILENVPALLQKDQSAVSDAEWIVTQLEAAGYSARFWKFAAEDFGSRACRTRIYFLAWLLPSLEDPEKEVCCATLQQHLQWLEHLFQCMSLLPFGHAEFITCVIGEQQVQQLFLSQSSSDEDGSQGKQSRQDPKWQEEHCSAYRAHGLSWPLKVDGATLSVQGGTLHRQYLSARACELLYYLHHVYPMPNDLEPMYYGGLEVQYVDVNPTLARSVQNGSPWKSLCPTITGSSQICIRHRTGLSGEVCLRPLSGKECMALIGWDPRYYTATTVMTDSLLRNLAGNAFAAFAITPMLMLAICGWDTVKSQAHACSKWKTKGTHEGPASSDDASD